MTSALSGDDKSVAFAITFDVKPDCVETFLALLWPVLTAMRREATYRNAFLARDPEDACRFLLYETWADLDEVVEVQLGRAYRQAYHEALPDLLRAPRSIQVWRPLSLPASVPS